MFKDITIFTDGSCTNNGQKNSYGAYGYIILKDENIIEERAEFKTGITNNQMELQAFIDSLRFCLENDLDNITIYSDSQYCINGITLWIDKWIKNNWKTRGGEPTKNAEYWKELYKLDKQLNVSYEWVKAHRKLDDTTDLTHEYNSLVDEMCTLEVERNGGTSFEKTKYGK